MKEANNQNLFADPSELEKPVEIPDTKQNDLLASVPGYNPGSTTDDSVIEVRFCTSGRLSAPPVLKFRDYTLLASQIIAEYREVLDPDAEDEHYHPIIEKVLNAMVVDDFDCGLLHIEEVKEVLLNIHGKWWGNNLTNFRYLINPAIKDEKKLMASENISVADIPLSAIEVVPLDNEVKEPINIDVHGTIVKFVYPRIRNVGIVDSMVKLKFAVEEQQFYKLKEILKYNRKHEDNPEMKISVDLKEAQAYDEYLAERARWRIIYSNAQLICGINDDIFSTFDDRVKAITEDKRLLAKHWEAYWDFLQGKGKFGIKDEAEFYSDILNQKVRRPFLFRAITLMPWDSVVSDRDGSVKIHFG